MTSRAMALYFHRTLRRPGNIIDVIYGHFHQDIREMQILWNLHTSFEVLAFDPGSINSPLWKKHYQPFMSKVYAICLGPKIDGCDTFLAAREDDVLQFSYSSTEKVFVCDKQFSLPRLCINPSFIYFWDKYVYVSASHGGVCCFDLNDMTMIY